MIYNKQPHPENFEYVSTASPLAVGDHSLDLQVREFEGHIFHIRLTSPGLWTEEKHLCPVTPPPATKNSMPAVVVEDGLRITVRGAKGQTLLQSQPGMAFGIMGKASLFCFEHEKTNQYFGLGEKCFDRFELSHQRARFWNTDALGDFPIEQWREHSVDPYYVSVPYVVVRKGDDYVGLLIHNSNSAFIDLGADASFFGDQDHNRRLVLGAEDGVPSLWVIVGPSLPELTTKLAKLCGTPELPPLWALGYHQCRWGYKGEKDLLELDAKMEEHKIPNDGLWLDIDYMEGYRVFTYAEEHFPNGVAPVMEQLAKNGRVCCPIIDPGVKKDPSYEVYTCGVQQNVFCKNPAGKDFVGFVWPGLTVYPDFSEPKARTWWADYAAGFLNQGFGGAWLDMNDPSTGAVDPYGMLFRGGKEPHIAFRNQYALGMQMATHDGFRQAKPNDRVFLLSRSGYVGTSRWSAIWTGDNVSTRFYLRAHIPQMLNMGLSGIPFAGNDIGGFAEDTNEALMIDWVKGYFLLPFFRIHSQGFHRPQEPWAFSKKALTTIRHYIQLRYKLLPYLYQLQVQYSRDGHPMWRPTMYHYAGEKPIADQFMVGRDILQAPLLDEGQKDRKVHLPGSSPWFDLGTGKWLKPGKHKADGSAKGTPIYVRAGAILPTAVGLPETNKKDLRQIEAHFFLQNGDSGILNYTFDDGQTLDYQRGGQSEVKITATLYKGILEIGCVLEKDGYGALSATGIAYGDIQKVKVNGKEVPFTLTKVTWTEKAVPAVTFAL